MATIFPGSASVNQEFNGYRFNGTTWDIIGQEYNPTVYSGTQPVDGKAGDIWIDSSINVPAISPETILTIDAASSLYLTQNSASTTYATKTELNNIDLSSASAAAVAAIVDSAPSTLNTLNELAAALNDDANFASTITAALGNKLDSSSASTTYLTQSNASTTYATQLSPVFSGTANFSSASVIGILDVAEVRETVVSNSFSTNVMTANYNDGAIHYATVAPTANFTISLTNVPTTISKSITMSFLITQGSTGYIPTTLNLNGSSQTIRWVGGLAPTPTSSAGKIDIFNFTLILAASNVVIASANLNI